jgi:predicted phosphodiesterase
MKVLAIGDTHAPYSHPNALDFLADLKRRFKPEVVVHIGDLGDQYGWSRHDPSPDAMSGGDEVEACLAWCKKLYKIFPVVKVCIGNHDDRLAKAAIRARIPSKLHRTLSEVYASPTGWDWQHGHVIDGIAYTHGEGFSGPDAAIRAARILCRSCVIGHTHSVGGVRWATSMMSTIVGCSTGCLVDRDSHGLAYARRYALKPVLGSAVVLDGIPQFIPLVP